MSTHPLLKSLEQAPSRAAEHEAWTMEADGAEVGAVGFKADALRLRRTSAAPRDATALGHDLAGRARYLLEPLEVVESDAQQAILRSRDPEVGEDGCDYYEMALRPDELSLERFHGQAGQRRAPRPLNLTWEQAERLVRDVEAAYDAPRATP